MCTRYLNRTGDTHCELRDFPNGAVVKNLPAGAGDTGSILHQEDPWRRKWQPVSAFLPGKAH